MEYRDAMSMAADDFINKVLLPACKKIEERYFLVQRADATPAYRERVYAYELYHQIRLGLEQFPSSGLVLHGELDKSGTLGGRGKKPDLLLHSPGGNRKNIAAVEIKRAEASSSDIAADLAKLRHFTSKPYWYQVGVLIVFGEWKRPVRNQTTSALVKVISHAEPGNAFLIE